MSTLYVEEFKQRLFIIEVAEKVSNIIDDYYWVNDVISRYGVIIQYDDIYIPREVYNRLDADVAERTLFESHSHVEFSELKPGDKVRVEYHVA